MLHVYIVYVLTRNKTNQFPYNALLVNLIRLNVVHLIIMDMV